MSNRLRASMRASNKGRSLRPRTSPSRNSAVPPESGSPLSAEQDETTGRLSAEPEESEQLEQADVSDETKPSAVPPPPPAPSPSLTPPKGTPAEVLAAGEAFSDDEDEDDAVAPSAPTSLPATVRESAHPPVRVEAPAKVEPVAPAKKAEEPKKAEPVVAKKAEEPKKAEPVVAKKAEPVVVKKAEEPRKAEAPASSKKGEPIKTAAKKVDESAAALRADRSHDDEPRSGSGKKKGSKGEGAKADAKRPATGEEVDDSSISAEFFRREGDSLPPLVGAHEEHEDHEEHPGVLVLSPAAIARQARLRRIVAGVVAFAGVITLAVVGKTLAAGKPPMTSSTVKPPVVQEAKVDPKPEEKVAPAPEKKAVEAPKASAEVARAEPDPKADAKAAEDAKKAEEDAKKAEEPKKAEPSGGDAKALTKEAESFLNRGNRKDAMVKAREAIAADPSEAMAYLLLGSALQDSGKWKDGIEAYSECVRNATKGPVSECRQMGGHK